MENMGTILTALVLVGIVAAIILKIRRDRKKNVCAGCSCSSSCDGCESGSYSPD